MQMYVMDVQHTT